MGWPAPDKPELVPVGPGAQDDCVAPAPADGAGPLLKPLAAETGRGAVPGVVVVGAGLDATPATAGGTAGAGPLMTGSVPPVAVVTALLAVGTAVAGVPVRAPVTVGKAPPVSVVTVPVTVGKAPPAIPLRVPVTVGRTLPVSVVMSPGDRRQDVASDPAERG